MTRHWITYHVATVVPNEDGVAELRLDTDDLTDINVLDARPFGAETQFTYVKHSWALNPTS